jgi:hypothetical protein
MLGPAWHTRQGYETCGCAAKVCRKRRKLEVKTMKRIERREVAREMKAERHAERD